jgi:hypothetical protein
VLINTNDKVPPLRYISAPGPWVVGSYQRSGSSIGVLGVLRPAAVLPLGHCLEVGQLAAAAVFARPAARARAARFGHVVARQASNSSIRVRATASSCGRDVGIDARSMARRLLGDQR